MRGKRTKDNMLAYIIKFWIWYNMIQRLRVTPLNIYRYYRANYDYEKHLGVK